MDAEAARLVFNEGIAPNFLVAIDCFLLLFTLMFINELFPWPPRLGQVLITLAVTVFCGLCAWGAGSISRTIEVGGSKHEVIEHEGLSGFISPQSWPFSRFEGVTVERIYNARRPGRRNRVAKAQYQVTLHGAETTVLVASFSAVNELSTEAAAAVLAESAAWRIGQLGGWPALRRGYELGVDAENNGARTVVKTPGKESPINSEPAG